MGDKAKNPSNIRGVSFPDKEFLIKCQSRASSLGLSLSNYLRQLAKKDLEDGDSGMQILPSAQPAALRDYPNPPNSPLNYEPGLRKKAIESGVSYVSRRKRRVGKTSGNKSPSTPESPAD